MFDIFKKKPLRKIGQHFQVICDSCGYSDFVPIIEYKKYYHAKCPKCRSALKVGSIVQLN